VVAIPPFDSGNRPFDGFLKIVGFSVPIERRDAVVRRAVVDQLVGIVFADGALERGVLDQGNGRWPKGACVLESDEFALRRAGAEEQGE
jgi:hypothetical protein